MRMQVLLEIFYEMALMTDEPETFIVAHLPRGLVLTEHVYLPILNILKMSYIFNYISNLMVDLFVSKIKITAECLLVTNDEKYGLTRITAENMEHSCVKMIIL